MKKNNLLPMAFGTLIITLASQGVIANCKDIKASGDLQQIANDVVDANASKGPETGGGFNLPMWVTVVDETGKVCQVINTHTDAGKSGRDSNGHSNYSWLGSRVISAQKANTANAFSLDAVAISTANLYGLVQPGGSLYGLQHSNPVDAKTAYAGSPSAYGTARDPLKNKRIGGINVFGGGLALYKDAVKIGAIGVSGDASCTDHTVAWRIRSGLKLDSVPGGLSGGPKGDELVLDTNGQTANTVQQPTCPNPPAVSADNGVISELVEMK